MTPESGPLLWIQFHTSLLEILNGMAERKLI